MINNKDKTKFKLISKKEVLDIIKKPKKSETYKYRKLFNGDEELICLMSPQEPKSIKKKDKDMDLENKLFTFLENFEHKFDSKFNDFKQDINSQLNDFKQDINLQLNNLKTEMDSRFDKIENRLDKIEFRLNKIESLPTIQKELNNLKK